MHYDLPVALAVLAAMGITEAEQLADWFMVRELALDARVAPSPGGLLAAIHASEEEKGLICPAAQGSEAKWASDVPILAAPDLASLLNHLKGTNLLPDPERGLVEEGRISPFRAPHHSASMAALTREGLKVNRAKSASHISACCSWTSPRNSSAPCSTRCASRSRRTGSISRWPPRA